MAKNIMTDESVQKLGRSISSGRPGLRQGCMVCSVRWSVPAWRYCPDAFAVTRGGYLERRDAAGREFPPQQRVFGEVQKRLFWRYTDERNQSAF
jgi:hypothetical protein